jgi:hypothetical protein
MEYGGLPLGLSGSGLSVFFFPKILRKLVRDLSPDVFLVAAFAPSVGSCGLSDACDSGTGSRAEITAGGNASFGVGGGVSS